MYKFTALVLALALSAGSASAQSTGRSSIISGNINADEAGRLDIVRGSIQQQLNIFIGNQRKIITELEDILYDEISSDVQQLCVTLYNRLIEVNGVIIPVPVSVPAQGVILPPGDLDEFCRNVMLIEIPGAGHIPDIKPPFLVGTLPPACNPRTQDLSWDSGSKRWECVTTLSGRCAPADSAMTWVPVTTP